MRYGTDGSGGTVFSDLGFGGAGPTYIVESVPEPTATTFALLAGGIFGLKLLKRKSRSE